MEEYASRRGVTGMRSVLNMLGWAMQKRTLLLCGRTLRARLTTSISAASRRSREYFLSVVWARESRRKTCLKWKPLDHARLCVCVTEYKVAQHSLTSWTLSCGCSHWSAPRAEVLPNGNVTYVVIAPGLSQTFQTREPCQRE